MFHSGPLNVTKITHFEHKGIWEGIRCAFTLENFKHDLENAGQRMGRGILCFLVKGTDSKGMQGHGSFKHTQYLCSSSCAHLALETLASPEKGEKCHFNSRGKKKTGDRRQETSNQRWQRTCLCERVCVRVRWLTPSDPITAPVEEY